MRRDEAITAMLSERVAAGDFPSAVYAVSERGRLVFADALGDAVRSPDGGRFPALLTTIYDLASLTKPLVTGLLAAKLLERGAFELDAEVSRFLRHFSGEDKRRITVRQLLTHTSGLPAWTPVYVASGGERERALDAIVARPLAYEPGTRVLYSDLGFITLGLLLAHVSRRPLAELAREEIFEPLKLRRTFFNPERALQTEVAACESAGNAYERGMCGDDADAARFSWREGLIWGEVHDGNAHFLGGAAGHAGLFSDAAETSLIAAQFLAAQTRLLRPETCALFRTDMTEGLTDANDGTRQARSLAWQLAATEGSTAGPELPPDAFGHLGFTGTSVWIDPARERVFVLLTNRTHARTLPFVNINSTRRRFHTLAARALERDSATPGAATRRREDTAT
ncbi:MAG TPA: serine hydrolase domain-containing protein [Pyrinomonadaceae bacterium]|nr:serine hydrolase domain-containing protein [Pyrinomonadaceae bacterium]